MKKLLIAAAIGQALAGANQAYSERLEETLVEGNRDSRLIIVSETLQLTPDSAALLRKAPGANFNSNGPLTGIAQLRGMFGSRVATEINGHGISAGGPNWMDPPLSYAPAGQLQSLEIFRGIAPVSAGQETIGGAVHASTWKGEFTNSETLSSQGRAVVGGESINGAGQLSAATAIANDRHKLNVAVLAESGGDAAFPGGDIVPTEYERQRLDLGYALKSDKHRFHIDIARNETGDAGTPALPMDIGYINADLGSAMYHYDTNAWKLEAMVYANDIEHGMTNYDLRPAPAMDSMWRRNIATGKNRGLKLKTVVGSWHLGVDHHSEVHDSNIDNPNNPAFFVVNFNQASREVSGLFAEYEGQYAGGWSSELGLRLNRVSMDAGEVDGTPAMMMPPAQVLRDNFNQADRSQSDSNGDVVAKLSRQTSDHWVWYLGLAQKTRSASYQERYLWLPMEATAGLADGRTYIGNIELKPEVGREVEAGFDVSQGGFTASPRIFAREVSDYIQGTPVVSGPALMFASMMGAGTPLQFNNVDARFYGLDVELQYSFGHYYSLDGLINYVRGERQDIDDDLYRIAPLNGSFALNADYTNWGLTLESVLYAGQNHVSSTQSEQETAGYGLLNLQAFWRPAAGLQLAMGVENALDKRFQNHTSGYNRVMGGDIPVGERLYGYGRNISVRIDYHW